MVSYLRETLRNFPQLAPTFRHFPASRKLATQASNTEKQKASPLVTRRQEETTLRPRPIQLLQTLRAMDGEFRVKPWSLPLSVLSYRGELKRQVLRGEEKRKRHPLFSFEFLWASCLIPLYGCPVLFCYGYPVLFCCFIPVLTFCFNFFYQPR